MSDSPHSSQSAPDDSTASSPPTTKDASAKDAASAQPAAVQRIATAAQGLEYSSETDAPLQVFFWPTEAATLTPDEIVQRAGTKPGAPLEADDVDDFFADMTTKEKWMKEADLAKVKRFQDLVAVLKAELEKPDVLFSGTTEQTAIVYGRLKDGGGFAGLMTTVVGT